MSRKACRKVNSSWLTASVPTPHATPNRTIYTESTIKPQCFRAAGQDVHVVTGIDGPVQQVPADTPGGTEYGQLHDGLLRGLSGFPTMRPPRIVDPRRAGLRWS
jgi:hypothetical protein